MTDVSFTLIAVFAGVILAACAIGATIALVAILFDHRNHSRLGEESVREILGYEPSHWPMNGHRGDDESLVP